MKYPSILGSIVLGSCLTMATVGHCAPIAYVGSSYGSSNSSSGPVTIGIPAGTANGDVMLAYIATQTANGAWITAPAGWSQVIKTFNQIQGAQLFWRVANNEPASYTWSGTSYPEGIIRTYRNVSTAAPTGGAGCGTNATSCQVPALAETVVPGEQYVGFWDFNDTARSITGPSDLGNTSRNSIQRSMFSGDKLVTGSTIPAETATVTGAATYFDGIGMTLKPPVVQSGVAAISANDFLNSMGIDVRTTDDISRMSSIINYIGYRVVKAGSFEGGATTAMAMNLAQATNSKILWGLASGFGTPGNTGTLGDHIAAMKQLAGAGRLLAVEGANEPDNWGVVYNGQQGGRDNSWIPVAQLQRDLYAAVKADPVLKNYPVLSISHSGGEKDNVGMQFLTIPPGSGLSMPDGTKYADYANMHNYVIWYGAPAPVDNIAWKVADPVQLIPPAQGNLKSDFGVTWKYGYHGYSDAQLPTLPRMTTETGWWSANGGEENQGKVLLNVYLAQFKRGYKITCIYHLKDDPGDAMGITHSDWSYKPAVTYFHNLMAILNDDRSASTTLGSLNYSIAMPATVHDMLLQKSTGAFELVVWDERPVGEATDHVTVNLGGTHAQVKVYDVTAGTQPVQTLTNVSSVPLTLNDHPLIVEVVN